MPARFTNRRVAPCGIARLLSALGICAALAAAPLFGEQLEPALPTLDLPDAKIAEVYLANWHNTLGPCREVNPLPFDAPLPDKLSPHAEPRRPWRVDVAGHYPGWYPGVDVKHSAAAYLATARDLPLVLQAWDLTVRHYVLPDGGVMPSTMRDNPQGVWPEKTVDGSVVYYPLRLTATIDLILFGDLIFRYSQDRRWLAEHIDTLRRAARLLEGWIDAAGLLHSHSYDLDQVYREIDGVAQASAYLAFCRLADLEKTLGDEDRAGRAQQFAALLQSGAADHFWSEERGYFVEHLTFNNLALAKAPGVVCTASSTIDNDHLPGQALDGIIGIGIDAFGVGVGEGGKHEWAARETVGAWLRVEFSRSVRVDRAVLINRTERQVGPSDRFAAGRLEFSDGGPPVEVAFNDLGVSRAAVQFAPRTTRWVRFVGTRMQGAGGLHGGLAEFIIQPEDRPYLQVSHGMTDTNLALLAFDVASDEHARRVWQSLPTYEQGFYQVGELRAPTWISQQPDSYLPGELNKRAPYKDVAAMGRIWRYDALMRRRMNDAAGLVRTLADANVLFERPSGGGAGWFAERYGLGRFQPGDEAQFTIAKYAEYPAVYNSTVVQEALLGLTADTEGTIHLRPCVPESWYETGFGQRGLGVLDLHDLAFTYRARRVEGSLAGPTGKRTLALQLPPQLVGRPIQALVNGQPVDALRQGGVVQLELPLDKAGPTPFEVVEKSGSL